MRLKYRMLLSSVLCIFMLTSCSNERINVPHNPSSQVNDLLSKPSSSSIQMGSTELYEIPTGEELRPPEKGMLISDESTHDAFIITNAEDMDRLLEMLDSYMPSEDGMPSPPKSPGMDIFRIYETDSKSAVEIDYYTNTDMQRNEVYYLDLEKIKERAKKIYYYRFEALNTEEVERSINLINDLYSQAAFFMQSTLGTDTNSRIVILSSVELDDDDRQAFEKHYNLKYEQLIFEILE